jgi:hypothetical protein
VLETPRLLRTSQYGKRSASRQSTAQGEPQNVAVSDYTNKSIHFDALGRALATPIQVDLASAETVHVRERDAVFDPNEDVSSPRDEGEGIFHPPPNVAETQAMGNKDETQTRLETKMIVQSKTVVIVGSIQSGKGSTITMQHLIEMAAFFRRIEMCTVKPRMLFVGSTAGGAGAGIDTAARGPGFGFATCANYAENLPDEVTRHTYGNETTADAAIYYTTNGSTMLSGPDSPRSASSTQDSGTNMAEHATIYYTTNGSTLSDRSATSVAEEGKHRMSAARKSVKKAPAKKALAKKAAKNGGVMVRYVTQGKGAAATAQMAAMPMGGPVVTVLQDGGVPLTVTATCSPLIIRSDSAKKADIVRMIYSSQGVKTSILRDGGAQLQVSAKEQTSNQVTSMAINNKPGSRKPTERYAFGNKEGRQEDAVTRQH